MHAFLFFHTLIFPVLCFAIASCTPIHWNAGTLLKLLLLLRKVMRKCIWSEFPPGKRPKSPGCSRESATCEGMIYVLAFWHIKYKVSVVAKSFIDLSEMDDFGI